MAVKEDNRPDRVGFAVGLLLILISYLLCLVTLPFSLCVIVKLVNEYERAVIFRLGRILKGGAKGPGMFIVLPCIDEYQSVQLRTKTFDIPPQEILTKDSVTIAVDAVVYYRVQDPTTAVVKIVSFDLGTRLLSQTALRNELGTRTLAEILTEREDISKNMQEHLDKATDQWGVLVERVEIKDVRLPRQLQRAMAAEAEATREAGAKVIAAQGEMNASMKLKEAAEVMSSAPNAMQLRYLQTLNMITAEKDSTIVFPIPIDIVSNIMPK